MLRGIPRSPLRVTTGELEAKLADEGFAVSRRTLERDLHGLSGLFPLELDDRVRPYGWSWAKGANFEFMPKLTSSQARSEEHTSELQSLMRISYAVFCLKKKKQNE